MDRNSRKRVMETWSHLSLISSLPIVVTIDLHLKLNFDYQKARLLVTLCAACLLPISLQVKIY